jgi:hypothetical protein
MLSAISASKNPASGRPPQVAYYLFDLGDMRQKAFLLLLAGWFGSNAESLATYNLSCQGVSRKERI